MGANFVEPPVESLHWAEDQKDLAGGNEDARNCRVMIAFVDWITQEQ